MSCLSAFLFCLPVHSFFWQFFFYQQADGLKIHTQNNTRWLTHHTVWLKADCRFSVQQCKLPSAPLWCLTHSKSKHRLSQIICAIVTCLLNSLSITTALLMSQGYVHQTNLVMFRTHSFPWQILPICCRPVRKIPWLTATKLSKFRSLPWPSTCA